MVTILDLVVGWVPRRGRWRRHSRGPDGGRAPGCSSLTSPRDFGGAARARLASHPRTRTAAALGQLAQNGQASAPPCVARPGSLPPLSGGLHPGSLTEV